MVSAKRIESFDFATMYIVDQWLAKKIESLTMYRVWFQLKN